MNKKILYIIISIVVLGLSVFIVKNTQINNVSPISQKLDQKSNIYKKANEKAEEFIKENGAYILEVGKNSETYLILNSTNVNSKNEVPYYSNIKIKDKNDKIVIDYNEKLIPYVDSENREYRLIYKIKRDENTEYMLTSKNGKQSFINSVIIVD